MIAVARLTAARLGRQRQTGSLCVRSRRLAQAIIAGTQQTRLGPFLTPQTFELQDESDTLDSGRREYEDGPRFFTHFRGLLRSEDLVDKDVLDLGCGYGGRTVFYARQGARTVTGNEVFPAMVDRCRRLAARLAVENVRFDLATGEDLPYADDSFDAVLSYDVLEHVDDPYRVFGEIARVLRPGASAWLVFPTYLGARASHLDYLTQVPMLHRVFDPDVLIEVVNEFLTGHPEHYGVKRQPPPHRGPLGRRVLPTLNGTSRAEALAMAERTGLETFSATVAPFITPDAPVPGARVAAALLDRAARLQRLPDLLAGSIKLCLRKPPRR